MTEKTKYIIRRVAKLTLTSPIWSSLLFLGVIAYIIGFVGVLIQGIGKSFKSGGQSMDTFLTEYVAYDGSWCDKMAEWVNK